MVFTQLCDDHVDSDGDNDNRIWQFDNRKPGDIESCRVWQSPLGNKQSPGPRNDDDDDDKGHPLTGSNQPLKTLGCAITRW